MSALNVAVIGGGPGGLFSSILLKRANPEHTVTIYERNAADVTFGFGVVFSQDTLDNIERADPESYQRIEANFRKWSAIDVDYLGFTERSDGHAFAALGRKKLLSILGERAAELGVDVRYSTPAPSADDLEKSYDVVIASDGVNSLTRSLREADFGPSVEPRASKYVWYGTTRPFDCFTFLFVQTEFGMFWAHVYPFDGTTSTFIVETDEETWRRAGLADNAAAPRAKGETDEASREFCERIFAEHLQQHPLIGNNSAWLNFQVVSNKKWHSGNTVLVGDAAHTAHFSIGSGTKLALEDAIGIAGALIAEPTVADAFAAYERDRRPVAASIQRSALTSLEWFENIQRYETIAPEQFVFQLLTRSQRVTYDNLKLRDPGFVARLDSWLAQQARDAGHTVADGTPPMFFPFTLKGLELNNRIVVSPMAQYSAVEGMPTDWHMVHLGSRAVGGAGLVMTEMVCTSPDARITPGCPGIWTEEQGAAWGRIVHFIHTSTESKIGIQIGHAGRKGATKVMWEGIDEPLASGAWPIVAPSAIGYRPDSVVPRAMEPEDIAQVIADHVAAAEKAADAGFDLLELHFGHGYLVSSFLSPLSNHRTDGYGGDLESRARLAVEILDAVQTVWPADRPISVRISATDWAPGGTTGDDAVALARILQSHGADIIDVSTGQTTVEARPQYGRLYQTPFSDRIRHEVGVPTMTVGAIASIDDANTIVMSGRADLALLARPHLVDPYWTLNAAMDVGYRAHRPVPQYQSGMSARRRVQTP